MGAVRCSGRPDVGGRVCLPERSVSAQVGVCLGGLSRGCLPGGVCLKGVCLTGCLPVGCLPERVSDQAVGCLPGRCVHLPPYQYS